MMQLVEDISVAARHTPVLTGPEPTRLTVRLVDPTERSAAVPAASSCSGRVQRTGDAAENAADAPNRDGCAALSGARWDALVLSHPNYSFFHSSAWARVLKEAYGFRPMYFVQSRTGVSPVTGQGSRDGLPYFNGGPVVAVLPLMETRSWIRGMRGVSLPFTDACAPLWSSFADASILLEAVRELGIARGWRFWELRGGLQSRIGVPPAPFRPGVTSEPRAPGLQSEVPVSLALGRRDACPTPESASFYGHVLDVAGGADAVFGKFDPSVRRAIRKSEKSGLRVEISRDREALREFYRLHCMTRGRHGVPPQPYSFFEAIQKHVIDAGHGFVVLASPERRAPARRDASENSLLNPNLSPKPDLGGSRDGLPYSIAASVYFHFGRRAIYKFGASDMRWQHLRANNLVMWTAIQHLAKEGFATLDMGRTDPSNEGLRAFKLGWGTTENRLPYYRYDFRSNTFLGEAGQSRWAGRLGWLPGPFARLAGALLYSHWE